MPGTFPVLDIKTARVLISSAPSIDEADRIISTYGEFPVDSGNRLNQDAEKLKRDDYIAAVKLFNDKIDYVCHVFDGERVVARFSSISDDLKRVEADYYCVLSALIQPSW